MAKRRAGREDCRAERFPSQVGEWVAAQIAHGAPEFVARFTLGMYQAAQEGRFAGVDPLLGELLGREPRTVRGLLGQAPGPDTVL